MSDTTAWHHHWHAMFAYLWQRLLHNLFQIFLITYIDVNICIYLSSFPLKKIGCCSISSTVGLLPLLLILFIKGLLKQNTSTVTPFSYISSTHTNIDPPVELWLSAGRTVTFHRQNFDFLGKIGINLRMSGILYRCIFVVALKFSHQKIPQLDFYETFAMIYCQTFI